MSAPVSFIECVSKKAYTRVLSCVMLALISSIIASIQLNLAIIVRPNKVVCLSFITFFFRFLASRLRHFSSLSFTTNARGDLRTWTLTLHNKALKQRLQDQIDSACAFGVLHRFMRLRAFSCGRVKTLRKR